MAGCAGCGNQSPLCKIVAGRQRLRGDLPAPRGPASLRRRFYGLLVDLIPVLLSYAGVTNTTVQYEPVPSTGGSLLPDGSWTGVC